MLLEKAGLPRIVVPAREYAAWEKMDGKWLYARHRIYNQAIPDWSAQDATGCSP